MRLRARVARGVGSRRCSRAFQLKDGTHVSDYEYDLPPGQIARYPTEQRDQSRLLVVPRGGGPLHHRVFSDIIDLFDPGDVLVVNESQVLPARLLGRKPTGAPSEILLLRPWSGEGAASALDPALDEVTLWEALVRPGGKLKPGRIVNIAPGFDVEIVDGAPGGGRIVRLVVEGSVREALERHGHVPLPPYLGREDEPLDRERYQTVYARVPGSVAAPTAGLHFTPDLLGAIEAKGVQRAEVTLDVGVGTFRPVEVDDPDQHEMHFESYFIPDEAARVINVAKVERRRVWAVGTTVVRTLESAARGGQVEAGGGVTDLFVRPGYAFEVIDGLITNFHLPRSTLLMLVAAFTGYERVMGAYDTAVADSYRFYSYGDAMVVG